MPRTIQPALVALADYFRESIPAGVPMVFAAMADKDWRGMLGALLPWTTHLVVTRPGNPRGADPVTIAETARSLGRSEVEVIEPAADALERAWRYGAMVVVTGSIFLVGELLKEIPEDHAARPRWEPRV